MHQSEIKSDVAIVDHDKDLVGGRFEDRPILATAFAPVDGSDVMVPVDQYDLEGFILALTEEQGMQLLLVMAAQLGKERAIEAIESAE